MNKLSPYCNSLNEIISIVWCVLSFTILCCQFTWVLKLPPTSPLAYTITTAPQQRENSGPSTPLGYNLPLSLTWVQSHWPAVMVAVVGWGSGGRDGK